MCVARVSSFTRSSFRVAILAPRRRGEQESLSRDVLVLRAPLLRGADYASAQGREPRPTGSNGAPLVPEVDVVVGTAGKKKTSQRRVNGDNGYRLLDQF